MKTSLFKFYFVTLSLTIGVVFLHHNINAQNCPNTGFESGNFSNWTGTWGKAPLFGGGPATGWPYLKSGFDQGANNQAANATPEHNHFIMTGGSDANVGGGTLPVVNTLQSPNTTSVMVGNGLTSGNGDGASISYAFTVDKTNDNFTYYYAVVLENPIGGHSAGEYPYFKIRMYDGSNSLISCATYDVDGSTAPTIGGFTTVGGDVLYKPWTAVSIPLKNYIGQNVKITFETRHCAPGGAPGTHYGYAYVDAKCDSLAIIPSAPSVCQGQNVTLKAPEGNKSYSWTGPGIVSGGNTSVVTVNTSGTYTVTITTLGNSPCTYNLTATMPANLPGSGVTVNSATICTGGTATLTASGGPPYTWSPGGATTASIIVTPGSTTSYSVSGGTCPSTNVGTVTVNPIPTSPFTVTPACIGAPSTITYTGDGSTTDTYTWDFTTSGGNIISGSGQGPYTVSWPSSGSKNVTLQVANGPCVSPVTTNAVTVNPLPVITLNSCTMCAGSTGTLNVSGANTYLWSTGATTNFLNEVLNTTTSYTVTGTDLNGCSNKGSSTITVNQLQNAGFSYTPATVCKAGGSNPTPIITGVGGGTFACVADANLIINSITGVVNLGASPVGTYTVTYTTPGPCPSSKDFVINIVNVPKADFTYGTYCQNVANPLPAFVNGGSAGTFGSTAGLNFISNSTGEINLATSTPGTYTVTNSINSPGCPSTSFPNSITINPVPVTKVDNQTVCTGGSATLTASGADSYSWSDGSFAGTLTDTPAGTKSYTVTGSSAGCTSPAIGTITVNPKPTVTVNSATICEGAKDTLIATGATTYKWSTGIVGNTLVDSSTTSVTYTVTGTTNNCSSDAIASVTVNPKPSITVNSPFICQGLSGTLTPSGGGSYIWSDTVFTGIRNITPVATKTYTVYGSTANCSGMPTTTPVEIQAFLKCWTAGCINSATSTVTLIQKPVLTVNSPTICIGQTATLTANGGATYTWSGGQPGNVLTVSPLTTTSYTVADNTAGCSGSTVSTVTVNNLPVVTANSATICAGQSATLTAAGASTYSWSNGSVTNPLILPLQNNATYTVTGTSAVGCIGTATTSVKVNPLPTVTSSSATICEGLSTTLTASGAASYVWSNNSVTNPTTVSPTKTTTYTVTGTDANNCTSTGTGTVTVFPKPGANFSVSPQPAVASYPTITFTDKSSKDVNYWHWDFGDGDTLAPSTASPVHTYPTAEATYTVTLNVLNAGFCPNSVTHEVVIGPEYSFFIPNAFSPNGDGVNDTFFGKGKGIIEYELMIFDRWGNFIFYADDINKGWDGKANGGSDVAQQDTYVWKVNLTDVFKKKHSFIGTVTLVKGE